MSDQEPNALEKQRLLFWKHMAELMRLPAFRAFAMWLIDGADWCKTGALTFDAENPRAQDYAEGRRSVGIQLSNHLQDAAPELFMRMRNEQPNLRAALWAPPAPPNDNKEQ